MGPGKRGAGGRRGGRGVGVLECAEAAPRLRGSRCWGGGAAPTAAAPRCADTQAAAHGASKQAVSSSRPPVWRPRPCATQIRAEEPRGGREGAQRLLGRRRVRTDGPAGGWVRDRSAALRQEGANPTGRERVHAQPSKSEMARKPQNPVLSVFKCKTQARAILNPEDTSHLKTNCRQEGPRHHPGRFPPTPRGPGPAEDRAAAQPSRPGAHSLPLQLPRLPPRAPLHRAELSPATKMAPDRKWAVAETSGRVP